MKRRRDSDTSLKYLPGVGAISSDQRRLRPLEWIALVHVGVFFLWITWAYGGGHEATRPYLAWWGSLGLLITLTALQDRDAWQKGRMRALVWLWPFVAFNLLVVLGTLNPSFREMQAGDEIVLVPASGNPHVPSSARPQLALRALWLFDAIWISCFNLALVIRQRKALRGLLLLVAGNALLLSIFGTVQKLGHARGPFFGEAVTRQSYFFSSFIYHNHWGAFTVLALAVCLGITWHYSRRHEARNALHSPAFAGVVLILLIAATIPLSGSRSGTLFMTLLFIGAAIHWLARLIRRRRASRESIIPPIGGAILALVLAVGGIWYVARDTIEKRAALTRDQVTAMIAQGSIGSRATLYRDTWAMAEAKPLFGWGMASYPHVFTLFNRQTSVDRLPVFYRDAHSDWLQAFAEHGFVGSALLALCAIVPLSRLRARQLASPIPGYLLGGCAVLLLYAWIEFPFGNLAVVLTWWLCFFSAIHYARLQDRDPSSSANSTGAAPA